MVYNKENLGSENLAIWAAAWQNQQNECTPSEDSDQPGYLPSLIRAFAIPMKKPWVLSYPLSRQRRLRSDWAHSHFVGFVMSQLICIPSLVVSVCCFLPLASPSAASATISPFLSKSPSIATSPWPWPPVSSSRLRLLRAGILEEEGQGPVLLLPTSANAY